jgi:hypothetical protein
LLPFPSNPTRLDLAAETENGTIRGIIASHVDFTSGRRGHQAKARPRARSAGLRDTVPAERRYTVTRSFL